MGFLRKSNSERRSPMLLIPKKGRGCPDCNRLLYNRKLSMKTIKDAFPKLRVDETLEELEVLAPRSFHCWTAIRASTKYLWWRRTFPSQRSASMENFLNGLWLFELATALATFCRAMNLVFAKESNIAVYFDDICVHSAN